MKTSTTLILIAVSFLIGQAIQRHALRSEVWNGSYVVCVTDPQWATLTNAYSPNLCTIPIRFYGEKEKP